MSPETRQFAEVRLWWLDLSDPSPEDYALLDPSEQQQAARFVQDIHRHRYIAAHAGLRQILATETQQNAAQLRFRTGVQGKPALAGQGPCFNLSHSDAVGLVAVCDDAPVGIDLEPIRWLDDWTGMLAQIGSPEEQRAFAALTDEEERATAFFRLWTRKEALLKAAGCGLMEDPRTVTVGLDAAPQRNVSFLRHLWQVVDLAVLSPYAAAVAVAADQPRLVWKKRHSLDQTRGFDLTMLQCSSIMSQTAE